MRHRLVERAGRLWGADTGPNPTDRGKGGSKHRVLTEGTGTPLAARVSGANAHAVRMLRPTLVACPLPGYGRRGAIPRRLPADRAYDSAGHEAVVRWLGTRPPFARRGGPHGSGPGEERYVVERTAAGLPQNRRPKVRYDRRSDIHQPSLALACLKLCWHRLDPNRK